MDSFFFLSGFLSSYFMTEKLYPTNGKTKYGLIYFHRVYRILPPIMFVTGFYLWVFRYMGDGPTWNEYVKDKIYDECSQWWWTTWLFINNFVPADAPANCLGFLWYLSNDMQFFLFVPLIIYLYCRKRSIGWLCTWILLVIHVVSNMIVTYRFNLGITILDTF